METPLLATPLSPRGSSSLWNPPSGIPSSWGAILHGKPPSLGVPPTSSPERLSYLGDPSPWGPLSPRDPPWGPPSWGPPSPWGLPPPAELSPSLGTPPSPWEPPALGDPHLGTPLPCPRQGRVPPPLATGPLATSPPPPPPLPPSSSRLPSLAANPRGGRAGATCPAANEGEARTLSSPSPSAPLTRLREKECTSPPGRTSKPAVPACSAARAARHSRAAGTSAAHSPPPLLPLGAAILRRKRGLRRAGGVTAGRGRPARAPAAILGAGSALTLWAPRWGQRDKGAVRQGDAATAAPPLQPAPRGRALRRGCASGGYGAAGGPSGEPAVPPAGPRVPAAPARPSAACARPCGCVCGTNPPAVPGRRRNKEPGAGKVRFVPVTEV